MITENDGIKITFTNRFGTFSIRKGNQIACAPFNDTFNTIAAINSHNDPRIITIINSDNNYDTRNIENIINVR